jgi:hypothetical protein
MDAFLLIVTDIKEFLKFNKISILPDTSIPFAIDVF